MNNDGGFECDCSSGYTLVNLTDCEGENVDLSHLEGFFFQHAQSLILTRILNDFQISLSVKC